MQIGALAAYERSLLDRGDLHATSDSGHVVAVDVRRWLAPVDDADRTVLSRCVGPVLDVGCGPGRFVYALSERGIACLGVDIAAVAVALTRLLGVPALVRCVFDAALPEGCWSTVILMDGNIGIGGDVARLLRRTYELLEPGGRVIVETASERTVDRVLSLRFSRDGAAEGPYFAWAQIGAASLRAQACSLGYSVGKTWSAGERTFVELER